MLGKKLKVCLIDTNWVVIKDNLCVLTAPKKDELIYINNQYYDVINVIHDMSEKKHRIFVVIKEMAPKIKIDMVDN
jgi:hypothetical protein